jgi:hypothetical protein
MLRLLDTPNEATEAGWVETVTPLGASAHVLANSPAHELCEDWRMLSTGRMQLIDKANFGHWFGPLFTTAPIGLVAELLMANGMEDAFAALLAAEPAALDHILGVADHCFGIDAEEAERLGLALHIARCLNARLAARAAVAEALREP